MIQLSKCRLSILTESIQSRVTGAACVEGHFEAIHEMGIRTYSKVNIKYFDPLAYDYITKIAVF